MRIGHMNRQPMFLGELFWTDLALESIAMLVNPQNVLVQRVSVGVNSRAQVAAKHFVFVANLILQIVVMS